MATAGMDHVKGALGPLTLKVIDLLKLVEYQMQIDLNKESEPHKEAEIESLKEKLASLRRPLPSMMEEAADPNRSDEELMGMAGAIEFVKSIECMYQTTLNELVDGPAQRESLKRELVCLQNLMKDFDYIEATLQESKYTQLAVKVWAEVRELSYDVEDVVDSFLKSLEGIDTFKLKELVQKIRNFLNCFDTSKLKELGADEVAARPASTTRSTSIDPRIQAMYTEIPNLVVMGGNMDRLMDLISDDKVTKVSLEISEKYSGTSDKDPAGPITENSQYKDNKEDFHCNSPRLDQFLTAGPAGTSEKMSSNDFWPLQDDSQYEAMTPKIKPKVACVVGFGGLGKTTLVRTLYDNIKKHFSCKAFVTVGRNADETKVLMDMLLALDKEKKEKNYTLVDLQRFDGWQLVNELEEFLCKKRYLIVIDDIWKENSWEFLQCAFHNEEDLGSQVFTTTRSISVAKACCSSSDGRLIYQMEPLSAEDSSSLFFNRVFLQEGGQCHDDFKQVSSAILKKCGGVPLAIITIASLLASSAEGIKPISEWKHVMKSIGSGLIEGESVLEMNRILSLSYDDLPPELKNCLLYMVVFPEDYVIKKDHLVSKWIAEDFVRRTNQEDSLFEVADNYFNMLIRRSIIEPLNIDGEGKANACRVHDMVLGFLCSLSSEANFVTIIDGSIRTTSNSETKIRRLSIQNCMATPQVFIAEHSEDMEHVRSFTLSSSNHVFDRTMETFYKLLCEAENGRPKHLQPLSTFQVLRVLDLRDCCPWLVCHQTKPLKAHCLLHLRYLGLRNTIINILPKDVGQLQFLQILDLRNHNYVKELPSSIVDLRGLIYLRVDPKTRLPDDFGKLTCLEKLTHVVVKQDSAYLAKQLGYLTNLRVLRITLEDMDENLAREFVKSLKKLQQIRTLDFRAPLDDKNVLGPGDCVTCMEESWEPSSHLQKFWAHDYYCFSVLPKWITEYCNISSLSICLKEVAREDIEILGRLQYLRYLNMRPEDRDNIYPVKEEEGFQFENDAFPVARELHIAGIVMLPAMFPKGAMPKVQTLEFDVRLEDFGNMNLEMAHLPALKKVKLISWYKIDVQKVTNGAQGRFNENYNIVRNYVHDVIGAHVKDAEASLRDAVHSHPNGHTIDIETRRYEHAGDLGKNKFKLLMWFLNTAEREAADNRICFSEAEAFEIMVSRMKEIGARKGPSQTQLDLALASAMEKEMSPATAFKEIMLAGRATRNPAKTLIVEGPAKSYAQADEEIREASGLPFLSPLDSDEVMLMFETLMSLWTKDEDEAAENQLLSNYIETIDVNTSRELLRLREFGEASGLPFLPTLDSDKGKLKSEFLLSMYQEQRVVEESIAAKLIEDRARAEKDSADIVDVEAFATCKGKEKIIYISDDDDVKVGRQPLHLTEIGEASGFPSLPSVDVDEDKFKFGLLMSMLKNDENETTEKHLYSSDVEADDVKASGFPSLSSLDPNDDKLKHGLLLSTLKNQYMEDIFQKHRVVEESIATKLAEDRARTAKGNSATNDDEASAICSNEVRASRSQPFCLTEIGEPSGFPSLLSLDPDEGKSKLKNYEDEATEKQLFSGDVEAVDFKASHQPLHFTEIGEASRFHSLPSLDTDEDELKFALLLSISKNENEEEIFQKHRMVGDSMATKLAEDREIAVNLNPTPTLPHPIILTTSLSPRAPILPPTGERSAPMVGTAAAATATLSVAEEPSKSKSTTSVSVNDVASPAQLDSFPTTAAALQGRQRVPYSSAESLDELEQKMLSAMASISLAKQAVQYELDRSRQEAKHNTLAAEKAQEAASENAELKRKLNESLELMKELVKTNKGLETKLKVAEIKVESAAQIQKKYMDLQITLQRVESRDVYKSKQIDVVKKEHEDLKAKYKEVSDSLEKLESEMHEKLQAANHYIN